MFKKIAALILFLCLTVPSQAAINATAVWEVRLAGDDNNGGCHVAGSGTDHSQQDAAWAAYTDLVIGGTTTELTSAATPFAADDVGNCVRIVSGTNCTVGTYYVVSVAVVTATMDRSVGTAAATCTGNLGGAVGGTAAWDFADDVVAGNTIHVEYDATAYTHTATILACTVTGTSALPIKWIGYQTTRLDDTSTRPTLTSATNSVDIITMNACSYNHFINIKCTHTAATRGDCFQTSTADSDNVVVLNSLFDGPARVATIGSLGDGWFVGYNTFMNTTDDCFTLTASTGHVFTANIFYRCGNGAGTFHGVEVGAGLASKFTHNYFLESSGDGVNIADAATEPFVFIGNAFKDNGSDGVESTEVGVLSSQSWIWMNNIGWSNGGYTINFSGLSAAEADSLVFNRNNAYGGDGTAARNNLSAGVGDVTITGDPFVDCDATLDCDLDNTASEGAAVRAVGFPGVIGGTGNTATQSYLDIGPSQHQDAGGGSGGSFTFVGP